MNKHLPHSVYLIHGWAANGRIFDGLRPLLPETWRVHTPDLPGHGGERGHGRRPRRRPGRPRAGRPDHRRGHPPLRLRGPPPRRGL